MCCKLRQSIYGLKQAAVLWYQTTKAVLKQIGFTQCCSDPCVFIRCDSDDSVHLVLYVDKLINGCADDATADDIKAQLLERFKLKDLGQICPWHCIQYDRPKAKLHICQSKFILRLIEKFGQESAVVITRRSTSGVLALLCCTAVIYKSKRQRSVALSSAEDEYVA
ncbi:hypothetical protein PsorP6_016288 [Peronosclerospora sorghi]|uniref:Uncharacterized protein n=1 Tax=Peronosclerospora sorghi TaxID=230839 RepID=A0ACC0VLF3_9STRA|nr:hypothetical protein PsorP6_016288 [Peronosclerospora sorghi]